MPTAISARIELVNYERMRNAFRVAPDATVKAVGLALYQTANDVFNESQEQVPMRRGTLRSTGFVSPPAYQGNSQIAVRISYGGASAPYAYVQHYNLTYRHAPGRKALYLTDPMLTAGPNLERLVGAAVGRALSALGL